MDITNLLNPAKEPVFLSANWIGRGKCYPATDTPLFIEKAFKQRFTIPDEDANILPSPAVLIPEFLKFEIPNTTLSALHKRTIPPVKTLDLLNAVAGQRWFDGMSSIKDPRYSGKERLPLYVIDYWRRAREAKITQEGWVGGRSWLHDHLFKGHLDGSMWIQRPTPLLGCSVQVPSPRSEVGNGRTLPVFIAPVSIAFGIRRGAEMNHFPQKRSSLLFNILTLVSSKGLEHLYYPVFVNGNHWITIHIDK